MMKLHAVRLAFTVLLVAASPAVFAQEPAAPPADSAPPPGAAQPKDAAAAANAELVGMLVKDLAVTPTQAEGAAGAVFSLAKRKLKPEDFGKVAAAVPGIDGLMKAAPLPDPKSAALDLVAPSAGVASLASSLGKLGLEPEIALRLVPAISGYLKGKGAGDAGALVGGLLK